MDKTNVIPARVSASASDLTNTLQDIKPPLEIPNFWAWVWFGVVVLLLAALAWWLWQRRRRRTVPVAPIPVTPPHEKAWARLRQALELLDQPRPFCILVSDTVRVYLEERFNLRAPERTTEEFLDELQASPILTRDHKQTLGEFLLGCDLVKFARHEPAQTELQAIYDAAVRLVEETQPPPPFPGAAQVREPSP